MDVSLTKAMLLAISPYFDYKSFPHIIPPFILGYTLISGMIELRGNNYFLNALEEFTFCFCCVFSLTALSTITEPIGRLINKPIP